MFRRNDAALAKVPAQLAKSVRVTAKRATAQKKRNGGQDDPKK